MHTSTLSEGSDSTRERRVPSTPEGRISPITRRTTILQEEDSLIKGFLWSGPDVSEAKVGKGRTTRTTTATARSKEGRKAVPASATTKIHQANQKTQVGISMYELL
jgi:hypothetical protein